MLVHHSAPRALTGNHQAAAAPVIQAQGRCVHPSEWTSIQHTDREEQISTGLWLVAEEKIFGLL